MRISQKVKGVLMLNLQHIILLYEDEDIDRFSNLHLCTFNVQTFGPNDFNV